MDRYLKSLSSTNEKRFDRNRKDRNGTFNKNGNFNKRGGRYGGGDRRPRSFYKQNDSHSRNRFNQKNTLAEIRRLLKEIIVSQETTLTLLDKNQEVDHRIGAALEIIAAKTR